MKRLYVLLLVLLMSTSALADHTIWFVKGYASTLVIMDNHGNGPVTLHDVGTSDPRPLVMPGELELPISYTVTMSDDHYNVEPIISTSKPTSDPNCTGLGIHYEAHPQWAAGLADSVCSCGGGSSGQCRVI